MAGPFIHAPRPLFGCRNAAGAGRRHGALGYNSYFPHVPFGTIRNDQVCIRHRRRGFFPGQGDCRRLSRCDPRIARPESHSPKARPVHQRRSRHDEPVPARRSVRHRRRRRNRPGSGPLRALHHHADEQDQQLHHRPDLRIRDPQGAPRGVSGQDRPGDPAYHQRDHRSVSTAARKARCRDRRDRRHGGRHRIAAVPRSGAPAVAARWAQRHARSST